MVTPLSQPYFCVRGVDEAVDQRHHADHRQQRADDVELAGEPFAVGQVEEAAHDQGDADRDVDEQHPPPVEVFGEDAAEQQAQRGAGAGHRGVHGERPVAFLALRERRRHQRQRGGRRDGPADALDDPTGEEQLEVRGGATEEAAEGEQGQADDEHLPAPEDVAGPPAQQQQAAERQRVRVDRPRHVGLGLVEVAGHRRQGDVDDRARRAPPSAAHRRSAAGSAWGGRPGGTSVPASPPPSRRCGVSVDTGTPYRFRERLRFLSGTLTPST